MRRVLSLILIANSFCAVTQPLIDSANFTPQMREMFVRQRCKFTSINYRNTGSNYTWNFPAAPFVSTDTLIYDSVDANNCDNHNYSAFAGRNFSFRLIATNLNCVSEFKTYSASGIAESGYGQPNDVADYNYIHFPFPMTGATNYSVTENYTAYHLSPFSTWSHVYYHSVVSDGYGDLNLPNNITYTNCLRVREVVYDTAGVSTASYDTIYYWLKPGIHHPVLTIFPYTPWQDAYYVSYVDRVNIQAKENRDAEITFFPNPTEGKLFFKLNQGDKNDRLIITNALGHVVLSEDLINLEQSIDISYLPSGVYFALFRGKNLKVVKQ